MREIHTRKIKMNQLLILCCTSLLLNGFSHVMAADASASHGVLSKKSIYQTGAQWTDDNGKPFNLKKLSGHPVVLIMFYTGCQVSCPVIVEELKTIHQALPSELREATRFVLVSMDSGRDLPKELHKFREIKRLTGEEWILLHGSDDEVTELAMLLGMKIKEDSLGQFAHSNLITVLNKAGEISSQRTGFSTDLQQLVQAIGTASL